MFEKLLVEKNITSVGFDLDDTLLGTDPYYIGVRNAVFKDIVDRYFGDSDEKEDVIRELEDTAFSNYLYTHQHSLQSPLIFDECHDAITDTFPEILDERTVEIVEAHTKDFYKKSPDLLPRAVELLNLLAKMDSIKNVFGATDGLETWSKVKAKYILDNTKLEKFPCFSTDIKVRKDAAWWESVFSRLHIKPENTLIIGDSYYADIYSSALVGVKNAIWINRYGKSMGDFKEYLLPEGLEVLVVNSIDEILEL